MVSSLKASAQLNPFDFARESRFPKNICLWVSMSSNLTPIESAICRQRGGRVFGHPPRQVCSRFQYVTFELPIRPRRRS